MKHPYLTWAAAGLLALSATACERAERKAAGPSIPPLSVANLDTTVRPCDDFWRYANGGWLDKNPIPASEGSWSAFHELYERNLNTLRTVAEAAAAETDAKTGSSAQLVGALYATGMDSAAIEKNGLSPLKPELDRIEAIANASELAKAFGRMDRIGASTPLSLYIGQDDRKSDEYAVFLNQTGMGLPTKDYYVGTDDRSKLIRAEYQAMLGQLLTLMGKDAGAAQRVFAIENLLAQSARFPAELREAERNYNKTALADLPKVAPGIDWTAYLTEAGVQGKVQHVILGQPEFFVGLGKAIQQVPLADWKLYLQLHLVRRNASFLPAAFDSTNFNFFGKKLRGQQSQRARWKRMVGLLEGSLGEALAKEYVAQTFSPEAKQKALDMVTNIQAAFGERIDKLAWMSPETKAKAQAKLQAIVNKIGYPDKWETYEGLQLDRSSLVTNVLRANEWQHNDDVSKLGGPIDRAEWFMAASEVNAYYNPGMNEIVFPAGILQPPFFHPEADDAVNYGGMGAVIGHELTHGFDDQGRKYDAKGNLSGWWAANDSIEFTKRANQVVQQYGTYKVDATNAVNGQLTLGENIADIGGLTIAYHAFQKTQQAKEGKAIEGLNPNQRFFLGFAQVWRSNDRPESLEQQVKVDPHSPAKFRVVGTLANMPEFAAAFNCQVGSGFLLPDSSRANIW